jgi:poly-beta-1,6-N-acetyl-D-glucosamine synthase
MSTRPLAYVLITPARNEEAFIEQTVHSMISQTIQPRKWVIVSDGSTDRTDDIVKSYLNDNPWIVLIRMPERRERDFAAKVQSFNAGLAKVQDESFDIIGNLDADISFGSDYFEFLLSKFSADATLGVAGTPFVEKIESYDFRFTAPEHVSGACQLFRRKCFDEIGGYTQVKGGGIDWIAVTTARMKGWKTRTFAERVCHHHRPMGTASGGKLRAAFKLGGQDYYLGGHPVWQIFRSCYQAAKKPYLVGGALLFAGYGWAWMMGVQRPISRELIRFHQHEQIRRLRQKLSKVFNVSMLQNTGS